MTILIDPPAWPAHGTVWSHMVSDTSYDELHEFARALGISRRAFDLDHYDVIAESYDAAVAAGAEAVPSRELVARLAASGLRVTPVDRPTEYASRRLAWLRDDWATLGRRVAGAGEGSGTSSGEGGSSGFSGSGTGSGVISTVDAAAWAAVGESLLGRWTEPHRRYHDDVHLYDVLLALDQLADDGATVTAEVRLAAWFHDAVYEGRTGEDERASAEVARAALGGLVVADAVVSEVVRLVLATLPGEPSPGADDANAALLLDADLAIFAAGDKRYRAYTEAVRAEYAHVPDAQFRAGRASILAAYLERAHVYSTTAGRRTWEARARANVSAEIAALLGEDRAPGS
ncbi:MAG: DUF4031 domain-containing protein [Pseudoclavibacter sp.]